MKEIFKWMAAHPDAKLEFSFAEGMGMGRYGCMAIEVRSRWDSKVKILVDVDIWGLLKDADEQHNYILSCLNDAYRKCVDERFRYFDGIFKELEEGGTPDD